MSDVRVRFAPSPTGFFHIGGARTALFNWLYARHTGGTFVLRIEDTDSARNTDEALAALVDGLKWLGLDWDEGPEKDGAFGPYFQSQRGKIYEEYLQKLLAADRAYEKDGAVYFRLIGERYVEWDSFKNAEVEKVKAPPVEIRDAVRGKVQKAVETDFVLRRSTGDYGFHFTNVVDDLAMKITHVIRGEDHLSNTPRHVELYRALGAEPPVFAHLPLILKTDGSGKMAKRDRGSLVEEYRERNYLPQAVRNFLCLLGWNPKDNKEVMPIEEVIERFDFHGIQKDAAKFDEKKLNYLNTEYLRALPLETFVWMASPVLARAGLIGDDTPEDYLHAVLDIAQEKTRDLEHLPSLVGFFFTDEFDIDEKALAKAQKKGDCKARLGELHATLSAIDQWNSENIDEAIEDLAMETGNKKFDYFPILRLAASGQGGGPDLLDMLAVLGQEKVVARTARLRERL